MHTRTWPFGTTKPVIVLERKAARHKGHPIEVLLVKEIVTELKPNEAFVLIQKPTGIGDPGDRGIIIFTEGGPSGGYWEFTRTETAAEVYADADPPQSPTS